MEKAVEEEEKQEEVVWDVPKEKIFKVENKSGYCKPGKVAALKFRDMTIVGMGLKPFSFTPAGTA